MYDWQALKILTEPATEPVSTAQVKEQLRIDSDITDQDTMISLLIKAAREGVEKYLGRTLINTTYQIYWDYFLAVIELPKPPYQSITHVKYTDTDGVLQTLVVDTDYQIDLKSEPARITPAWGETWPSTRSVLNAVEVQYVAGYGAAEANVPQPIKQLITAIAVDLYEHPELNIELRINENKTYNYLAVNYKISNVW